MPANLEGQRPGSSQRGPRAQMATEPMATDFSSQTGTGAKPVAHSHPPPKLAQPHAAPHPLWALFHPSCHLRSLLQWSTCPQLLAGNLLAYFGGGAKGSCGLCSIPDGCSAFPVFLPPSQPTTCRGTDCPGKSHTPSVIPRWATGACSGSLTWSTGQSPLASLETWFLTMEGAADPQWVKNTFLYKRQTAVAHPPLAQGPCLHGESRNMTSPRSQPTDPASASLGPHRVRICHPSVT